MILLALQMQNNMKKSIIFIGTTFPTAIGMAINQTNSLLVIAGLATLVVCAQYALFQTYEQVIKDDIYNKQEQVKSNNSRNKGFDISRIEEMTKE